MDATTCKDAEVQQIIAAALRGELVEQPGRRLHALGPEAVALIVLAVARQIVEQNGQTAEQQARMAELESKLAAATTVSPSTPSGQIPIYQEPAAPKRRRGKPGAKPGHKGTRRARSERPDRQEERRLKACPDYGGHLRGRRPGPRCAGRPGTSLSALRAHGNPA